MERSGGLHGLRNELRDWRVAVPTGMLIVALVIDGAFTGQLLTGRDPCMSNDEVGSYVSAPICAGYRNLTNFLDHV